MARRTDGLRDRKSSVQTRPKLHENRLDYHEGLSANQVKVILRELDLYDRLDKFNEWMHGQTCPVVYRPNRIDGRLDAVSGIYEYDLFRWIENQRKGTPLVWD